MTEGQCALYARVSSAEGMRRFSAFARSGVARKPLSPKRVSKWHRPRQPRPSNRRSLSTW